MTEQSKIQQPPLQIDAEFLTVEQTARLLQVPVSWVYRQTRRNTLPGMRRLGKYIRISRRELLAWLEAQGKDNRLGIEKTQK
jgi:excisionase family DNA binding protein